ncbi:MAG TPA: tetratricopeptide repeat protein [Candidatus Acidoferrum sp.]|nr:tetratricopeptide repeat protein [Candidatus Acidoferrum sp.]
MMISLLLGSVECRAQSATSETLSPPILPTNTPVTLHLTKNLYKKDAKPGQLVEFEVGFDVVVNGQFFIPSKAAVTGILRQVDRTGKGLAKVLIYLGPAQTVSGEAVRLAPTRTTTASNHPDVADAVTAAGQTGDVLLDSHAGCGGWSFGLFGGCGVWVVAYVAESVALDLTKQKAAQTQYNTKQSAAELGFCRLLQSRNPESSPDESALFALFTSLTPLKAELLHRAGDLDAAIAEYQQALALKIDCPGLPKSLSVYNSASLHVGLAELFREKRDLGHAIAEYRTVVQLDPNGEHTREGFSSFLVESDDPNAALAEINEAMRLWPENIYFHLLRGKVLVKKNDPDAAIAELQLALKQWKNHSWQASCALGSAYELKGDLKVALRQYRTAYRVRMHDEQCRGSYERLHSQLKK